MQSNLATYIIVLGRGLTVDGDRYELTAAGQERVKTLVTHLESNSQIFSRSPAQVVFTGGWSEPVLGPTAPPAEYREGVLMMQFGLTQGLMSDRLRGCAKLYMEVESRTTLENFLHVKQMRPINGVTFTEDNPLGLIAHSGHMKRAVYLARKVFRTGAAAIQPIVAEGRDKPDLAPEPLMLLATRIFCLGVSNPARLCQRHRLMGQMSGFLR
jgi:hypothetical protein